MSDKIVIVTFLSARNTIKANRFCENAGIEVSVIATPSDISSECGMSLRINVNQVAFFENVMKENNIEYMLYER